MTIKKTNAALKKQLEEIAKQTKKWEEQKAEIMKQGTTETIGEMEDLFGDFFYNFMNGSLDDMGKSFEDWGKAILKIIAQVISKLLIALAIKAMVNSKNSNISKAGKYLESANSGKQIGGTVASTGMYQLEKGERVIPAHQSNRYNQSITGSSSSFSNARNTENISVKNTIIIQSWTPDDIERNQDAILNILSKSNSSNSLLRKSTRSAM